MSESRITYRGSLDMSSVPQLIAMVQEAARKYERVTLDLTDMDFVDSTGVRSLISLRQQLEKEGKGLSMEGFRPEILDILDILGVRELLLAV